ncbi:hypothetical protein [Nonomuraea sp. JJY05]|jgi:hypothetical protein|uniref:hypothetical protein n=1 Tax=Nonomuraea sp. JJY05 TaxID=3350255 RepID=UPI00373F6A8C
MLYQLLGVAVPDRADPVCLRVLTALRLHDSVGHALRVLDEGTTAQAPTPAVLGARDRAQAVVRAHDLGLVPADD